MLETGNIHIISKSEQSILSIRLSTYGFSFCIHSPIENPPAVFTNVEVNPSKSLAANLKSFFSEQTPLSHQSLQVNVIIADKRFTLLPTDLFDENQIETTFYYNHSKRKNEVVLFNKATNATPITLFGIDKSVYQLIKAYHPEANFYSLSFLLNECSAQKVRKENSNSNKMFVYFGHNTMALLCYEQTNLQLINWYEVRKSEDIIYYLLGTWKQLDFNQENDELHLGGNLSKKESLMEELKKYILNVFTEATETNIELEALLNYASN